MKKIKIFKIHAHDLVKEKNGRIIRGPTFAEDELYSSHFSFEKHKFCMPTLYFMYI